MKRAFSFDEFSSANRMRFKIIAAAVSKVERLPDLDVSVLLTTKYVKV